MHQAPITYAGWTGEGYIVLDPLTGAGAYKISGGGNGGVIIGGGSFINSFAFAVQTWFDAFANLSEDLSRDPLKISKMRVLVNIFGHGFFEAIGILVDAAKILDACLRAGQFISASVGVVLSVFLSLLALVISRVVIQATFPTLGWIGNIGMNLVLSQYGEKLQGMVGSIAKHEGGCNG